MKSSGRNLIIAGSILLTISCVLAYLWHYWLLPLRRVNDPAWLAAHTTAAKWIEIQKQIHRTGLDHDSSIAIGRYGDKRWMEWVVKKLKPDHELADCGHGQFHLPDAPFYITNQRLPDGGNWTTWWATNQHKSQVEWIRDGFQQHGIELHQPLTSNNVVSLLKLIATSRQGHLQHNANRWLRDSGFAPEQFYLTSVAPEHRDVVTEGLHGFNLWLTKHQYNPGRRFRSPPTGEDDWNTAESPLVARPIFYWSLNLTLTAIAASGVFLLFRGFSRSRPT